MREGTDVTVLMVHETGATAFCTTTLPNSAPRSACAYSSVRDSRRQGPSDVMANACAYPVQLLHTKLIGDDNQRRQKGDGALHQRRVERLFGRAFHEFAPILRTTHTYGVRGEGLPWCC